jgi:hypothetical protein
VRDVLLRGWHCSHWRKTALGSGVRLLMHAYQHYANLVMLDAGPSCERPTAVIREYSPRSTRGRVPPYRKVRCLKGHLFTLLLD